MLDENPEQDSTRQPIVYEIDGDTYVKHPYVLRYLRKNNEVITEDHHR